MTESDKNKRDLVLVVDDSPETLGMLNATLEREGMAVLVALEGAQALTIAERMRPDIILLDAVMPNMDGFEVCRKLKLHSDLKSVPVIFMTGLSDTESVVNGFEVGGIDYVTKPIRSDELIARMKVHLANTRLTKSAHSALDISGQFIFATDKTGRRMWETPQVTTLFEKISASESAWKETDLPSEIGSWLKKDPMVGQNMNIVRPDGSLRLTYLGNDGNDENLFRVVDRATQAKSEELIKHLKVTQREAEVLLWISRGKTNREIGQILGASPHTINKHSEKILKKLGVENRTSAAAKALQFLEG